MKNNTGWMKLHRSFLEWEWYSDVPSRLLFLHLLLKVNWEEKKWQGKTILPGQLVTSIAHLSEETGLSQKVVRNKLNNLIETGELGKQTTNKFTIITLLNWSKYQGFEEENEDEGQTTGKQRANNGQSKAKQRANNGQQLNNIKKERKKELKNNIPLAEAAGDIQNSIYSFSQPEQVSAVQMMDSLARWERLTKVWVTSENEYILKGVRDKYFLKFNPSLQEEIVQYVEKLSPVEKKYLSNLWIGPLLKQKDFRLEYISIEIEKKKKINSPQVKEVQDWLTPETPGYELEIERRKKVQEEISAKIQRALELEKNYKNS